jgi:hypothetical protein
VTQICAGALLFDHPHESGTKEGAEAVARDIRASTSRRLEQIQGLRTHPSKRRLAHVWLAYERTLAALYADTYLRIWQAIDNATTPSQKEQLPRVLGALLHRPDTRRAAARAVEQRLGVPDCTGGENTTPGPDVISRP